jgi:hypothetical protein
MMRDSRCLDIVVDAPWNPFAQNRTTEAKSGADDQTWQRVPDRAGCPAHHDLRSLLDVPDDTTKDNRKSGEAFHPLQPFGQQRFYRSPDGAISVEEFVINHVTCLPNSHTS